MSELTAAARELLLAGVRFRHQGRDPATGLDCVGMILHLIGSRAVGRQDYGRLPMDELVETVASYCTQMQAPIAGALVLIRWPGERRPGHAALAVEDPHGNGLNLIHCFRNAGGIVEHGFRGPWLKRAASFWRLPQVSYE